MENVAHSMVGLLTAKAGLERLSPGATAACLISANLPDADVLTGFGGRWFLLEQHRGVSHSLVAVIVLPLVLAAIFKLGDLVWHRLRGVQFGVRFWPLGLSGIAACATHPILDWTNNYGIRPFLPFSAHWYYGDLVFIVDPWIWLIVGGAAFIAISGTRCRSIFWLVVFAILSTAFVMYVSRSHLPARPYLLGFWFAGLIIIAVLRYVFRLDRNYARVAVCGLVVIVAYWCALGLIHHRVLSEARVASQSVIVPGERVQRIAATPTFADARDWQVLVETDAATYRYYTSLGSTYQGEKAARFPKLTGRQAEILAEAEKDPRARVFLGFARFPAEIVDGNCGTKTLVQFADLRYTQPDASNKGSFGLSVEVRCSDGLTIRNQ